MYTKGDWKVVHEFNVEAGGHRGIASCGAFTNNKNSEGTRRENIANAHLISASPDLYEACKEAEKDLWLQIACLPNCKVKTELVAHRNQILEAISKAEGGGNNEKG